MGALPYKTNGNFIRWEPYHIKQKGLYQAGALPRERLIRSCGIPQLRFILHKGRVNMQKLDLYHINLKYIRDLSKVDDNVMSISPQRGNQNSLPKKQVDACP